MTHPLHIWKLGGASLADADGFRRAAALITAHSGPLVVVVSAIGGVTDLLLEGAQNNTGVRVAAEVLRRHRTIVKDLVPRVRQRRRVLGHR